MAATPRLAPARPSPAARARPDLRVVAPARRGLGAPVVVLVTALVFVVLLGTAGLNTVIVARQRHLDRVEDQIREGNVRNEALRLRVAELESPARIVEQARADGMDIPDEVTWLAPRADGGADSSTQARATAPEEPATDTDREDGRDVDERASAGTGPTSSDPDGTTGSAG